jgi:predicted transcriptional regulator
MNNNNLSTEWRRSKVMELSSQGYNQSDIAKILQISQPTISRDIQYLKQLARSNITKYIDKELPFEYDKCLAALHSLQKKAWEISQNSETEERTKVQALSLAKECVINKLELLTNATVVDDAIRFVQESKEKLMCSKAKEEDDNDRESKEPDDDHQKLEQEQEEESITTTNQVF